MQPHGRVRTLAALACVFVLVVAACSDDEPEDSAPPSTTSARSAATTTTTADPADAGVVVFSGAGNNLDAYSGLPPFEHQRVNAAFTPEAPQEPDPEGTDINAQICFFPDGSRRFIAGEDKNQGNGDLQGWGIFELTGDGLGSFGMEQVAKLVPTYQSSDSNAENYGCGILSDGRIVTTDIGDQATGDPSGQLIVWYPPFDSEEVQYCKIEVAISTAQSLFVDEDDHIFLAAARPTDAEGATGAGVWEYSPPYPSAPDADGGCGKTDRTGAPLADYVERQSFIKPSDGMVTPSGIVRSPAGGFYVSSVFTGVINEYDDGGDFVRTILEPPEGEGPGPEPLSSGAPLGMGIAPDGTIYFADIGIVVDDNGVGPGSKTGSVRRITFTDGEPDPPETMAKGLDYPDGIGILVPEG